MVSAGGDSGEGSGKPGAEAAWRFALAVYAEDGVEAACLALQDKLGVDIAVLLFAAFVTRWSGQVPSPDYVALIADLGAGWQKGVVRPLRVARRSTRGHREASQALVEALRAKVKEAEQLAERIEITLLAETLPRKGPPQPASAIAEQVATAFTLVLVGAGMVPDDEAGRRLETIAAAAAGVPMV